MALGGGPEAPPLLPLEIMEFRKLVTTSCKRPSTDAQQKFVKKIDNIPAFALPAEETCQSALKLAERGLIG
jgi:hypothetical protein